MAEAAFCSGFFLVLIFMVFEVDFEATMHYLLHLFHVRSPFQCLQLVSSQMTRGA